MSQNDQPGSGATAEEKSAARRAFIIEMIHRVDPVTPLPTIDNVVASLITNTPRLNRTAYRLREHPNVLTSGSSHPLVQDLVLALRAAGVQGLVSPHCPVCGRDSLKLDRSHPDGGRQCQRCWVRTRKEPCSQC